MSDPEWFVAATVEAPEWVADVESCVRALAQTDAPTDGDGRYMVNTVMAACVLHLQRSQDGEGIMVYWLHAVGFDKLTPFIVVGRPDVNVPASLDEARVEIALLRDEVARLRTALAAAQTAGASL